MRHGWWIAFIAVEVVALCCCGGLGVLFFTGYFGEPRVPTSIARAVLTSAVSTPTTAATLTAEPTNTRVIQNRPTATTTSQTQTPPTLPSNLYNVVVPTPTAARIVYPVDFVNTFVLVTYPVSGTTLANISKSLDAHAMSDPHEPNSRYYARTDWYISYRLKSKATTRGCELDKSGVTIALTMTLPALATTAPRDVMDRWSMFIQKAILHESGHVRLAQDGARTFQRDLGNLLPAVDCSGLDLNARDLFNKSFAAIDKANVQYDVDTQHGVTQGATFP